MPFSTCCDESSTASDVVALRLPGGIVSVCACEVRSIRSRCWLRCNGRKNLAFEECEQCRKQAVQKTSSAKDEQPPNTKVVALRSTLHTLDARVRDNHLRVKDNRRVNSRTSCSRFRSLGRTDTKLNEVGRIRPLYSLEKLVFAKRTIRALLCSKNISIKITTELTQGKVVRGFEVFNEPIRSRNDSTSLRKTARRRS